MQMQCSTSPCYCSEQTNMLRRQIIGGAISPAIANPNGLHGRADHLSSARCNFIWSLLLDWERAVARSDRARLIEEK